MFIRLKGIPEKNVSSDILFEYMKMYRKVLSHNFKRIVFIDLII